MYLNITLQTEIFYNFICYNWLIIIPCSGLTHATGAWWFPWDEKMLPCTATSDLFEIQLAQMALQRLDTFQQLILWNNIFTGQWDNVIGEVIFMTAWTQDYNYCDCSNTRKYDSTCSRMRRYAGPGHSKHVERSDGKHIVSEVEDNRRTKLKLWPLNPNTSLTFQHHPSGLGTHKPATQASIRPRKHKIWTNPCLQGRGLFGGRSLFCQFWGRLCFVCYATPHSNRWWDGHMYKDLLKINELSKRLVHEWILRDYERMLLVTGPLNTLSPTLC